MSIDLAVSHIKVVNISRKKIAYILDLVSDWISSTVIS